MVEDLYSGIYKTLMRETKEDTKKWKDIPSNQMEELTLLKCPYHPKQSIDSMQSLSKYQCHFS